MVLENIGEHICRLFIKAKLLKNFYKVEWIIDFM